MGSGRRARNPDWSLMERTRCLTRALELGRAVRDADRSAAVIDQIRSFVDSDLGSDDGGPGISLRLLAAIVDLPETERPGDVDALLVRAGEVYGDDPHIADSVADLRTQLLDADGRAALRCKQVDIWRAAAQEGDGLLRVMRLERALDIARTHGLAELAEELRRELQSIGTDSLDLKKVSGKVELPRAAVDAFLTSFTEGNWQDALSRLGAQGPPGGEPDELEEQVARDMREFPLQYLFTKAIVGPDRATAILVPGPDGPSGQVSMKAGELHGRTRARALLAAACGWGRMREAVVEGSVSVTCSATRSRLPARPCCTPGVPSIVEDRAATRERTGALP